MRLRHLLSSFLLWLLPAGIRVVGGHRLGKFCCVGAKVLFVNGSGFVDNKSHYTRRAVFHRVSDEGESCAHLAIDNVILGTVRCVRSLAGEDSEHIPIEGNMLANFVYREILPRESDERVDRAVELIGSPVPIQTIVLPFIADQSLGKLLGKTSRRARKIFFLSVD